MLSLSLLKTILIIFVSKIGLLRLNSCNAFKKRVGCPGFELEG